MTWLLGLLTSLGPALVKLWQMLRPNTDQQLGASKVQNQELTQEVKNAEDRKASDAGVDSMPDSAVRSSKLGAFRD